MIGQHTQKLEKAVEYFTTKNQHLSDKGFAQLAQKNVYFLNMIIESFNAIEVEYVRLTTKNERISAIFELLDIKDTFKHIPTWYMKLFPARTMYDILFIDRNFTDYQLRVQEFADDVTAFQELKDFEIKLDPIVFEKYKNVVMSYPNDMWKSQVISFATTAFTRQTLVEYFKVNQLPLLFDHRFTPENICQ
jgi:hypothetical protein